MPTSLLHALVPASSLSDTPDSEPWRAIISPFRAFRKVITAPLLCCPRPHLTLGVTKGFSISLTNVKVSVDIDDSDPSVVGYNTHQALPDVADRVVVVQQLDVRFHRR